LEPDVFRHKPAVPGLQDGATAERMRSLDDVRGQSCESKDRDAVSYEVEILHTARQVFRYDGEAGLGEVGRGIEIEAQNRVCYLRGQYVSFSLFPLSLVYGRLEVRLDVVFLTIVTFLDPSHEDRVRFVAFIEREQL
jgi:hypothetical protein